MIGARTAIEAGAVATGVVAVTASPLVLGVPAGVLLAAYAGALFGLAYTKPEAWGALVSIPAGSPVWRAGWVLLRSGGLVFTLTMFAFLSSWATLAAPHVPGCAWMADLPPLPFAGLLAFSGQYLLPIALKSAGEWIKRRGTPAP